MQRSCCVRVTWRGSGAWVAEPMGELARMGWKVWKMWMVWKMWKVWKVRMGWKVLKVRMV